MLFQVVLNSEVNVYNGIEINSILNSLQSFYVCKPELPLCLPTTFLKVLLRMTWLCIW